MIKNMKAYVQMDDTRASVGPAIVRLDTADGMVLGWPVEVLAWPEASSPRKAIPVTSHQGRACPSIVSKALCLWNEARVDDAEPIAETVVAFEDDIGEPVPCSPVRFSPVRSTTPILEELRIYAKVIDESHAREYSPVSTLDARTLVAFIEAADAMRDWFGKSNAGVTASYDAARATLGPKADT